MLGYAGVTGTVIDVAGFVVGDVGARTNGAGAVVSDSHSGHVIENIGGGVGAPSQVGPVGCSDGGSTASVFLKSEDISIAVEGRRCITLRRAVFELNGATGRCAVGGPVLADTTSKVGARHAPLIELVQIISQVGIEIEQGYVCGCVIRQERVCYRGEVAGARNRARVSPGGRVAPIAYGAG